MATTISLKQEEAKTITLTITQSDVAVDVSSATLKLAVKRNKNDSEYSIEKLDAAFDKDLASTGVVTVPFSATDTDLDPGSYTGELKIAFSESNIDKSADLTVIITKAVITD